jgi:hypothetical protein
MRTVARLLLGTGLLWILHAPVSAQMPIARTTQSAVEAVIGNQVLQARYFGNSPFSGVGSNLDYGALMFDTDIIPVPGLRFQVGPQLSLAWPEAGNKTDVFAASLGAGVRYEILPRFGLAAVGSAFYSPGVLTFGNAHNMYDFTAGAEARLAGRLHVIGGYRWLKFTLVNEPDERVANELFAGVRWQID